MNGKLFNPAKKYFKKIKQEEEKIVLIIEILKKQKNILKNDNITLEIEINRLNDIIKKLNKEYEQGNIFKEKIYQNIEEATNNYFTLNIIQPLEKKIYDIKQMITIKEQSIVALEIVRQNNKEIIRNIDRIQNVTIEALNTAVIVAKSMYNQKIILNRVNKLNDLESDFKMMEKRTVPISKMQEVFLDAINTLQDVTNQNKKTIPENELKIIELKKGEGYYEEQ